MFRNRIISKNSEVLHDPKTCNDNERNTDVKVRSADIL